MKSPSVHAVLASAEECQERAAHATVSLKHAALGNPLGRSSAALDARKARG